MKYICLVYGEEKDMSLIPDGECMAFGDSLRNTGQYIAAEALQRVETATVVKVRSGKISITDGPFAETKDSLLGFI